MNVARVQPGQRVLVHAAARGVGSIAVQLAKARGAYVVGTASASNRALVESFWGRRTHRLQDAADAAHTARNAARDSDRLAPAIERVAASADGLARMGNDVSRTSDSAGRTVESAAGGVLQVRNETLPELQRLLCELSSLAVSLRQLSEQTERNPSPAVCA